MSKGIDVHFWLAIYSYVDRLFAEAEYTMRAALDERPAGARTKKTERRNVEEGTTQGSAPLHAAQRGIESSPTPPEFSFSAINPQPTPVNRQAA